MQTWFDPSENSQGFWFLLYETLTAGASAVLRTRNFNTDIFFRKRVLVGLVRGSELCFWMLDALSRGAFLTPISSCFSSSLVCFRGPQIQSHSGKAHATSCRAREERWHRKESSAHGSAVAASNSSLDFRWVKGKQWKNWQRGNC